jgi:hypothetical protein
MLNSKLLEHATTILCILKSTFLVTVSTGAFFEREIASICRWRVIAPINFASKLHNNAHNSVLKNARINASGDRPLDCISISMFDSISQCQIKANFQLLPATRK